MVPGTTWSKSGCAGLMTTVRSSGFTVLGAMIARFVRSSSAPGLPRPAAGRLEPCDEPASGAECRRRLRAEMPQLEPIDAIERRLWSAADTLRANSKYASNEYFLPVMGLVFLRHACSRYLAVKDEIEGRPADARRQEAGGHQRGLRTEERSLPGGPRPGSIWRA